METRKQREIICHDNMPLNMFSWEMFPRNFIILLHNIRKNIFESYY